jgi:hypothetical protein
MSHPSPIVPSPLVPSPLEPVHLYPCEAEPPKLEPLPGTFSPCLDPLRVEHEASRRTSLSQAPCSTFESVANSILALSIPPQHNALTRQPLVWPSPTASHRLPPRPNTSRCHPRNPRNAPSPSPKAQKRPVAFRKNQDTPCRLPAKPCRAKSPSGKPKTLHTFLLRQKISRAVGLPALAVSFPSQTFHCRDLNCPAAFLFPHPP